MPAKSLMFLTPALVTAGLVIEPLAANAAGLHQTGTWGTPAGLGRSVSNLRCDGVPGSAASAFSNREMRGSFEIGRAAAAKAREPRLSGMTLYGEAEGLGLVQARGKCAPGAAAI